MSKKIDLSTASTDDLLDSASTYAFARLKEANGDPFNLPLPLQTLVIIYSAQAIIDNGGLEYFYESDFDGAPAYSSFVEAYRRIGAESAAACIETTAAMFPVAKPHLHLTERQRWLDSVRQDEDHLFVRLSRKVCGDTTVFAKLAEYVRTHADAFSLG